jgi:putative ABC transport system substrate-binding protein
MNHKVILFLLAASVLICFHPAEAQQPKKIARIGFLSALSPDGVPAWLEAFRQGLGELGYVEGKNIAIEWRYAEGKLDRLPALAAELMRLKVDVIVSGGPAVTRAAKEVTSSIPIVMGFDNDSVGSAFVANLARPGGNITGLSNFLRLSWCVSRLISSWYQEEIHRLGWPRMRPRRFPSL